MAILAASTSGIFKIFYGNLYKKETTVILKCIDQLPQNLAIVHNLVGSFDKSHKNFKFFYSSYCFHCFPLLVYCLSFCSNFDIMEIRGTRCSLIENI